MTGYFEANRANWDERVPIHAASRFYDVEARLARGLALAGWERDVLGPVADLHAAHLQCHFGLDTLALAADGARATGLDFSPAAIAEARSLAERTGLSDRVRFVEGNVLEAARLLEPASFDLVYVSLGALCWLPRVDAWAQQVSQLLRPGGRLYLHDGHPLAWAAADDQLTLEHSYFEETQPFVDDCDRTYTDSDVPMKQTRTYEWNHSIGETVSAVLRAGLRLDLLAEHDWTVYPRFPWLEQGPDGRWLTPAGHPRAPLSFTLVASLPEEAS